MIFEDLTMKLFTLVAMALLPFSLARAAGEEPAFRELKAVAVSGAEFAARVHYDPPSTTLVNKPYKRDDVNWTRVLSTPIDRKNPQPYEIHYTEGMSGDPMFRIVKVGASQAAGELTGIELFLPGNGSAYVSGHTNSLFDHRRKFELKDDKLVEVKQAFSYVGLASKALRSITIHADKKLSQPVAIIPAGGALTVVLNEGEHYLIKTPFGLLGWIRYSASPQQADLIEGLYFKGD